MPVTHIIALHIFKIKIKKPIPLTGRMGKFLPGRLHCPRTGEAAYTRIPRCLPR
jgi:hypothetical protein